MSLATRLKDFNREMKKRAISDEELNELAQRPPVVGVALIIVLLAATVVLFLSIASQTHKGEMIHKTHFQYTSRF